MNKRTERVKSIFDSDDSDDDNNISSLGLSFRKDDEDEDTKLRKTIEEVCSSLGNENESSGELPKLSLEEPNEQLNKIEEKETHCSSDSEEEKKNLKKDITPATSVKFVIPIIEENEYNLLSKFCNETVETSLEEEKSVKSSQFDEVKENIEEDISSSDIKEEEIIAAIINTDSNDPKKAYINKIKAADIGVDVNMEMEPSNIKELPEGNVGVQSRPISESLVEKTFGLCDASENIIVNNSVNVLENNIDTGCDQTEISGASDDKYQCNIGINNDYEECSQKTNSEKMSEQPNFEKISKQVFLIPTSKIGDFELELDKPKNDPSCNFDLPDSSHENKVNDSLIISTPTSPAEQVMDDLLINKMDENLEIKASPSILNEPKEGMDDPIVNQGIVGQSKCDETNFCVTQPLSVDTSVDSHNNSTHEIENKEYSEPSVIPGKLATYEVQGLESNIKSTYDGTTPSLEEKVTVENSQDERKNDHNCYSEGEKKRKVRVEDVFTDSESETASNCSPIKQALIKSIEHVYDSLIGPPLKKIRRKRPRATSINLPAIMLAFEKGWVREVVYRASANMPIFPKRADIYYYTPEGKKLRSRIEIEDYLKKNNIVDLTLQNFSFFKEPLGVEECYEKIRHASAPKLPMIPTYNEDQLLNVASKKRIRKSAKCKDGVHPAKKLRIEMLTKNILEKDVSGNIPLKETQRYYGSGNFSNVLNNYSPVYATHLFPCNPPLSYPRIITSLIKGASKDKAFHCTPNCFAGGGSVPNLQCVKCICLFHPDCCHVPLAAVPLILSSQAKFLCPNCYKEETENFEEKDFTPTPCFEPLAYDPPSDSEDEGLCSDYEHPSYTRLYCRPSSPQITASQVRHLTNLHTIPNIAMLSQPTGMPESGICHGSSSHVQNSLLNDGLEPSLPQYIPPYLPNTSAISASIKSVSSISLPLPSTYFHSTPSTPNSFPPPSPGIPTENDIGGIHSQTSQKKFFASKASQQLTPILRGGEYFMEDLSKCYSVLRHIFSYLSVTDLLVVSRVCHMWRDLALGPTFWTSVRLRNVCVKDWGKMVEFLERRGTSSLDLRKMVLNIEMESQPAGKITLEKDFGRRFSDANSNEDLEKENRVGNQEMYKENVKDSETTDEFENIWGSKSKKSKQVQLVTKKDDGSSNQVQNILGNDNKNTIVDTRECVAYEKKNNEEEMSEGETEIKNELDVAESAAEFKEEGMKIDALIQPNNCDSIMEVNNILSNEIKSLNKKQFSPHSQNEENAAHSSEDSQDFENMEVNEKNDQEHSRNLKNEADEEKLKEIQKDKIVTSVLSEHDYFGTQTKVNEPGDSSNSSTDSDDSDSQLDQNEIEADRALDEKLEFHKKNVEDGNLKEMLQWEHEPQIHPERQITAASCGSRVLQAEIIEDEVELVCKLKENNVKHKALYKAWDAISHALSKLRCLRNIIVGPCESFVVELLLSHCFQLTGITALNLTNSDNEDVISFDPSFLMHTKQLNEFRLGSKKNFLFKSNFNFIKLPDLKVLMLKGLKTAETGWPYMGIHLTHLHLSCINTFSHKNWLNISSMTGLLELELDGNGSDFDSEICVALLKLVQLKRLALLDWNIGPKLPFTLRKLHNIKYLHVIPAVEAAGLHGIYAGRLMVMLDFTNHLEEFVWGIQPKNRMMDEKSGEKIFIQTMKPGKETVIMEGEKVRAIAIDSFKGFIKCRIPQTKVTVRKVASSNWITGDSWF